MANEATGLIEVRVAIASSFAPFVEGGATYIVKSLAHHLKTAGHEVETLWLPFDDQPDTIVSQLLAYRLLDITEHADRLIAIRTPSHILRHPDKVVWFIHHYRGAYDLWGTKYQSIPSDEPGVTLREAIIKADTTGLREAKAVFCNSVVVRERLSKFNSITGTVLYPPLLDENIFYSNEYGDYLLYFARLTHHKRQWLAIEAMRYTRSGVKLVIAGTADPGAEWYVEELRELIARYDLSARVTMIPGWVAEPEKLELFAGCLAVVYLPFDEDSCGYPSLEAHAARKAVITTGDSGGTLELITDGRNGCVTEADPELIAEAMDKLYEDRVLARDMGESGRSVVSSLGINWENTIGKLLT